MRQCADGVQPHDATMIENLLKLSRRIPIPVTRRESLAAHIGRVQTAKVNTAEENVAGIGTLGLFEISGLRRLFRSRPALARASFSKVWPAGAYFASKTGVC
jgi:hypothetical protein